VLPRSAAARQWRPSLSLFGKAWCARKDTPNFIAIASACSRCWRPSIMRRRSTRFDTVDALTGRYLGVQERDVPHAGIVGLDVFAHVVNTMRENLTDDPCTSTSSCRAGTDTWWIRRHWAEDQARHLSEDRQEIHVLDLHSKQYRLSDATVDDGVKDILRERDWAKKLAGLHSNPTRRRIPVATFRDVFHYCALQLDSIADNARDLDFAVRWASAGTAARSRSGRRQAATSGGLDAAISWQIRRWRIRPAGMGHRTIPYRRPYPQGSLHPLPDPLLLRRGRSAAEGEGVAV